MHVIDWPVMIAAIFLGFLFSLAIGNVAVADRQRWREEHAAERERLDREMAALWHSMSPEERDAAFGDREERERWREIAARFPRE